MTAFILPDPLSSPSYSVADTLALTPLSMISPLSLSSPITYNDSCSSSDVDDIENLVDLMESLPTEIVDQIWSYVLLNPIRSCQLSTMCSCRPAYNHIIKEIYQHVDLTSSNAQSYFYGLGTSFSGVSSPEENWPVSGPGIIPLDLIGLSYDPSKEVSSFIRKFTLCNLVESLTISDPTAFKILLKAAGECWKYGMDTWRNRVLFDQIDSISLKSSIFTELDNEPLLWRNLLKEIWNVIKGDCVQLHFPEEPLKEETYTMAIKALGSPSSLGQKNRLLDEVVIYTPQLDGIDLNEIGCSKVIIHLIGYNNWIGCGEKVHQHPDCWSQEAQLRRFIRRHWLMGIDNTEYIGIPLEVEQVQIHNVALYNRRTCITGRLSQSSLQTLSRGISHIRNDEDEMKSMPTVLYGALEGDEQLAEDVGQKLALYGSM
ncbi:uncharacterized protein IL334_001423 [Kwoniella shivajii]|uniref:F-box domain-containing protein n=1 Tax=Kwoniella shivajii TaxID=564305 RepID=A0ABZ1CUY1_9TREE|nr:hypothetical protein IL334_001423 [Kwoniella shivajii]